MRYDGFSNPYPIFGNFLFSLLEHQFSVVLIGIQFMYPGLQKCAECHGDSGQEIVFRTEGVNEYLGSVAVRDPWRFLHRTRFGVAGIDMPIGLAMGWTPSEGRDVLLYAQSMPTGFDVDQGEPGSEFSETSPKVGGPGSTIWEGILTGTGMFIGMFGSSLIFISFLLIFVGLIVWVLRKRSG